MVGTLSVFADIACAVHDDTFSADAVIVSTVKRVALSDGTVIEPAVSSVTVVLAADSSGVVMLSAVMFCAVSEVTFAPVAVSMPHVAAPVLSRVLVRSVVVSVVALKLGAVTLPALRLVAVTLLAVSADTVASVSCAVVHCSVCVSRIDAFTRVEFTAEQVMLLADIDVATMSGALMRDVAVASVICSCVPVSVGASIEVALTLVALSCATCAWFDVRVGALIEVAVTAPAVTGPTLKLDAVSVVQETAAAVSCDMDASLSVMEVAVRMGTLSDCADIVAAVSESALKLWIEALSRDACVAVTRGVVK